MRAVVPLREGNYFISLLGGCLARCPAQCRILQPGCAALRPCARRALEQSFGKPHSVYRRTGALKRTSQPLQRRQLVGGPRWPRLDGAHVQNCAVLQELGWAASCSLQCMLGH